MSLRIFQSSSNQMEIDGLVNVPYIWDRDELEGRVELKFCK